MHPNNPHRNGYDMSNLIATNPALKKHTFTNKFNTITIDFSDNTAVFELNKALLLHDYKLEYYQIPENYLCPAIPGRADYLFYIKDLIDGLSLKETPQIKGLDIGVGANCIYPILGVSLFKWQMVGSDIDITSVKSATKIVNSNSSIKQHIEIRHQETNANIFEGIILKDEYFHFTICNPPFYASEEEANKVAFQKLKNLNPNKTIAELKRNFNGQSNELWCNGGEALFIKRMIKQSVSFKTQVALFTTLVSRKEHLNKFYKQLEKLKATHQTIRMSQGNKISHLLVWSFTTP